MQFLKQLHRSPLVLIACIWLLAVSGCTRNEEPEPPNQPEVSEYAGLYVLNEGQWTLNNASLSYYGTGPAFEHFPAFFQQQLGLSIGDVANDILLEEDTLYILVNGSRLLYKINLQNWELLGQMSFPEGADVRQIAQEPGTGRAAVSSLTDGTLYLVNLRELSVTATLPIENYCEGLCWAGGKLFVAVGNYTQGNVNRKLAILDSGAEQFRYRELPYYNPTGIFALQSGQLLVACHGTFFQENSPGGLLLLDPSSEELTDSIRLPGTALGGKALFPGQAFFFISGDKNGNVEGIARLALDEAFGEEALQLNALNTNSLGFEENEIPYGLNANPARNELYLTSYQGAVNGTLRILRPDGSLLHTLETGIFPGETFYY